MTSSNRTENAGVIVTGSNNSGVIAGTGAHVTFTIAASEKNDLDARIAELLAALQAQVDTPAQQAVIAEKVGEIKESVEKGDKPGFEKKAKSLETIMASFGKTLGSAVEAATSIKAIGLMIGAAVSFLA